jgi:hypothetical protein
MVVKLINKNKINKIVFIIISWFLNTEITRGHSWSLVVIRGHSWSLVVIRGHQWRRGRGARGEGHGPPLLLRQLSENCQCCRKLSKLSTGGGGGRFKSLVVTRGHSWSLVVTRGHSWSFVVIRGHSCVLLDKIL